MSSKNHNEAYIIRIRAVNGLLFLAYENRIDLWHDPIDYQDITHVLSIYEDHEPEVDVLPGRMCKQVKLEKQHVPDILGILNDVSEWVENALSSPSLNQKHETNQVIIRSQVDYQKACSNALLVGFLMRYLRTSFSVALGLAQESVPSLEIENGLERQLRIWEFCWYNIYQIDPQSRSMSRRSSVDVSSMPGTYPLGPVVTDSATDTNIDKLISSAATGQHKPAYLAWRKECDLLIAANRFRALSFMAATLGKQRLGNSNEDKLIQEQARTDPKKRLERPSKEAQWAKVGEMERTWNERLLKGAIPA